MVLSPSKKTITKPSGRDELTANSGSCGKFKLQRGPKPLKGNRVFLDIKNHAALGKLEASIKSFGGVVDPFIGKEVNLVVTDRPEWGGNTHIGPGGSPQYVNGGPKPSPSPSPSPLPFIFSPAASPAGNSRGSNASPTTLDSPGESNTVGGRRYSKSRAEAMLEKVRLQPQFRTRDPLTDAQTWGIPIWFIQKILKLFQKLSHDLSKGSDGQLNTAKRKASSRTQRIKCRTGQHFIKIETIERKNKPYYKDLPCWPTINLESELGTSPFNLKPSTGKVTAPPPAALQAASTLPQKRKSPRKRVSPVKKTSPSKVKKSNLAARSPKKSKLGALQDKTSASALNIPRPPSKRHPTRSPFINSKKEPLARPVYEPLTGYCEICKVDYPDLRAHVETDAHRVYSSNEANYASLDKLINSKSVCIDTFLSLIGANGENTCSTSSSSSVCESSVAAPRTQPTEKQLEDIVNTGESNANMRQPVDDRHIPPKMVGRKEALEVQCNGISSHVQTRFACAKGDRENLGGIFLGDRISAAQLRKRRAISVSCKDLLELSPSTGERTHYLRSGRAARSELSQLSPALSDNSHPLLNSNSQQPLLSPALSDKSHHLRTRSQLWLSTNLIEEGTAKVTNGKATGSLLVTANNHSDKSNKSEKSDNFGKGDRSDKTDKSEKPLQSEPLIKQEHQENSEGSTTGKEDLCEEDITAEDTATVEQEETAEILGTQEGPEKSDKINLLVKNTKIEVERRDSVEVPETSGEGAGKEVKDLAEQRELRPTRNHSKNKSVRRKRLSAEEKLIEDNRGYYKVEVLNSKLRSTGYFVNHSQGLELSNGRITPDCQEGEPKPNGDMKEPVVVRFKKVRRSELSVLSDEAENFMFGEQTRSDTNSEESSEYDEEEEEEDEGDDDEYCEEEEDEDGADVNGCEENGSGSRGSRSSKKNGRRSSGGPSSGKERPRRIRIKVGGDNTYTQGACGDDISLGGSSHGSNSEANGHRKYRKRRTQAEAFITDNMDYYKFEMAGSRLRLHGFPTPAPDGSDGVQQEKEKSGKAEETCDTEWEDKGSSKIYSCPIDKLHFSFESVPRSEVWFQTFQRQDRGEELYFPMVSDPRRVLLPYQVPKSEMGYSQRSGMLKRRSKVPMRLPRKSPRCHASTLAILSSLVRRRSRDPEKTAAIPEAVSPPDPALETESKSSPAKKVSSSETLSSDQQATVSSNDSRPEYEEDIEEIARNIDCMLGLVGNEADKDLEVVEPKVCGKGRGKKKQATKSVSVNSGSSVVPNSDRDKDPSLYYLVDPAVLEELSCTCDVVSNPQGGPSMDIVSLLDSYSNCCCIVEGSSNEHNRDASCNSSECGASTCEMDRRMRKKRKRRNMTGWDKPKRKSCLRRDVLGGQVSEDVEISQEITERESSGSAEPLQMSSDVDCELQTPKVTGDLSSPAVVVRKVGSKRKLRSSSSLSDSSPKRVVGSKGRGRGGYQKVMRLMDKEGEGAVLQTGVNNRRGTFKKVRRLGWRKIR